MLLTTSCGFQLRGSYGLSESLRPIYIDARGGGAVAAELRDLLRRNESTLTADPAEATTRLVIVSENRDRQILSIGDSANVDEYQLRVRVEWKLEDREREDPLIGVTRLEERDDYVFDPTAVLSKQEEEGALYERMSQNLARRILARLRAWSPQETD